MNRVYRKLYSAKQSDWQIRSKRDQLRLQKVIPKLISKAANCVDVGAHRGSFLDIFLKYAPDGNHYAFEPIPELYESLKERYTTVKIFPLALSDKKEEVTFSKVMNNLAWSGLKPQEYPWTADIENIHLQSDLMDNVIPGEQEIDFIKIDVEGAEFNVLTGAKNLIFNRQPTILFEHALIHNRQYNVTPEDVYDFFQESEMMIYRCDLGLRYEKQQFVDIYYSSYQSNYDRHSETNFIALKKALFS